LEVFEGEKVYIDSALQFATHLLENGIYLRYIQELLGYKCSKATEIYTHVSSKDIMRIQNPLDQILKEKRWLT